MITGKRSRIHEILLALLAGGVLLLWLKPFSHEISICIFRNITGVPCPACGTGHGVEALINGRFHAAWKLNPLSYLVLSGGLFITLILINDYLRKQNKLNEFFAFIQKTLKFRHPLTWILILGILIIWIQNIVQSV